MLFTNLNMKSQILEYSYKMRPYLSEKPDNVDAVIKTRETSIMLNPTF